MILNSMKRTQIVKKTTEGGGNMGANKIRWCHLKISTLPYIFNFLL